MRVTDEKNASISADFPVLLNDVDDRPALVSNGVLTKINESTAVIQPKVDQIGGGLHNASRAVNMTLYWGTSDGGTNAADWENPLNWELGMQSTPLRLSNFWVQWEIWIRGRLEKSKS